MKTIKYYTKNVYGNELMYLADANDAHNWYRLTGKKTIDAYAMEALKSLAGVEFERVFEPVAA